MNLIGQPKVRLWERNVIGKPFLRNRRTMRPVGRRNSENKNFSKRRKSKRKINWLAESNSIGKV